VDATNPVFFENRALVYTAKGQEKKALDDYQKALAITTDDKLRDSIMGKVSALSKKDSDASAQTNEPSVDLTDTSKTESKEKPKN
jgi:hypothetical protein